MEFVSNHLTRHRGRQSWTRVSRGKVFTRCFAASAQELPSSAETGSRRRGSRFVVLGIKHDESAEAFPVAFGAEVLLITQSKVQDAAFARRHRGKLIGRAGLAHFVGGHARGEAEFLEAGFAVSHAIKADFFVLVAGEMKHFHGEQFQRAQQFGPALEEESCVRTREFHQNFRTLPVAIVRHGRIDGDAVLELEPGVLHHGA